MLAVTFLAAVESKESAVSRHFTSVVPSILFSPSLLLWSDKSRNLGYFNLFLCSGCQLLGSCLSFRSYCRFLSIIVFKSVNTASPNFPFATTDPYKIFWTSQKKQLGYTSSRQCNLSLCELQMKWYDFHEPPTPHPHRIWAFIRTSKK